MAKMHGQKLIDQKISSKKLVYTVKDPLRRYLTEQSREIALPVKYEDLLRFDKAFILYDKHGKDSLWETAIYENNVATILHEGLKEIYSILKTEGDSRVHRHLHVERIDYCTFGNTNPFRIKIVNNLNDNYDYFYVKCADASRIYGLELEHILSPARINFFVDDNTLIEEHIAGVPGDAFITSYLQNPEFNQVRIAKEFVKFNERCFIRLLGDMRAYNYVFDITPDFEEVQFRIRAIDFDQQSYEGHVNMYLPQFFKENYPFVKLVQEKLTPESVEQYQHEERTNIARRSKSDRLRLNALLDVMSQDDISPPEKITKLKKALAAHYKDDSFLTLTNMGELVQHSLHILQKSVKNPETK